MTLVARYNIQSLDFPEKKAGRERNAKVKADFFSYVSVFLVQYILKHRRLYTDTLHVRYEAKDIDLN